jgi:anti-sigma-K factor RskA
MTHDELGDLYELYALGVLDPEERAEIEEHLAQKCPECKAGIRRAVGLNTFFGTLPETIDPPRRLRSRVLASVGAEPASGRFLTFLRILVPAFLTIVIAIVGMETYRRGQDLAAARDEIRRSSAELQKVQAAFRLLNLPETKQVVFGQGQPSPPRGRVFVNRERGVLLLASNLPPTPAGKTYEMWLIPQGGAPVPAGLFQSDSQGDALHLLSGAVAANTNTVAVTVEPEAGSQAPTTTPIIVAPVSD